MIRAIRAFIVLAALSCANELNAQTLDVEFQGRVSSLGNVSDALPALLNYINDVGFRGNVEAALESAGPEINKLLQWAPERGVLVGVTVQVPLIQPDGFVLREVLGGGIVYGLSASPQGALASYFERTSSGRGVLRPAPKTDWVISQEWSKHFWITRSPQGGVHVRRYEFGYLNRVGGDLFLNQELRRSLAQVEERDLLMTMADAAVKKAKTTATKQRIASLRKDAAGALQRLDTINAQLKAELERGAQMASVATTLGAIGSFISLAGQIDAVSSQLGSGTPAEILNAQSTADLNAALAAARQRNATAIQALQDTQTIETKNFILHKQTLVIELQNNGVPVDVIP